MNYIYFPKPILVDNIDVDRLKNKFDDNDIHYDSITFDGYMIKIITNAIPMSIFNLLKTKFNYMTTTKDNTLWH